MLDKVQDNILIVVLCLVLFNIVMTIIHGLLGIIKNYTISKVDNKAWKIVGKILGVTQKAIDYSVANKAHK